MPAGANEPFVLVDAGDTHTTVHVPPGMDAEVTLGQQRWALEAWRTQGGTVTPSAHCPGAVQVALPARGGLHLAAGAFVFVVRSVTCEAALPHAPVLERRPVAWVLTAALAHVLLLLLAFMLPPSPAALSMDRTWHTPLKMTIDLPPRPVVPAQLDTVPGQTAPASSASGAASSPSQPTTDVPHRGSSGFEAQSGRPSAASKPEATTVKSTSVRDLPLFVALRQHGTKILAAPVYTAANAETRTDILGQLEAEARRRGPGGWNLRSGHHGPARTVGVGDLHTGLAGTAPSGSFEPIGHRAGLPGVGTKVGSQPWGTRDSHVPRVVVTQPPTVTSPGLPAEVIRRVVRLHRNEVRACYTQGLQSRPDLAGRVSIAFTVSPSGAVQSSVVQQSSLGDRRVEACVAQAVRRWSFPQPRDGGVVAVRYPFVFQSAQ
ncbi:MAG: TonB family protein [Polyangiales bacterium]